MKRATVIGGNGFIGRALTKRLRDSGWHVWTPNKGDASVFDQELGKVFYCAGLTADFSTRLFDTVDAHVCLLNSLVHQASFDSLVYLSSTRVYDGMHGLVDENMALQLNPNNRRHLYDLSKLMGESICLNSGKGSVARLSCVYRDETDPDGFLPNLLSQVLQATSPEVSINTSPFYQRDYVCLDDVISALICIADSGNSTIYNVASGENLENSMLFSLVEEICNVRIHATQNTRPTLCPEVSISRMYEDFMWQATPALVQLRRILLAKIAKK